MDAAVDTLAAASGFEHAGTAKLFVFIVQAARDPQAMLRVAGLFALRNLIPRRLCCRAEGTSLHIELAVELEDLNTAMLMLEKIRSLVVVEDASLRDGAPVR